MTTMLSDNCAPAGVHRHYRLAQLDNAWPCGQVGMLADTRPPHNVANSSTGSGAISIECCKSSRYTAEAGLCTGIGTPTSLQEGIVTLCLTANGP
jgi:hypothetical protein